MLDQRATFIAICCLLASCSGSASKYAEIRRIPVAEGIASHPVNGGHCLISDDKFQYIVFYDGEHQMTVGKRKLGDSSWEFTKLPEKVGWDTHNKIMLFQDKKGYLHITGNMHCSALRYYKTKMPGDINTFEAIHKWTGEYEDSVTYPSVLKLRDGSVYLMYRHGGSGDGAQILIHYDDETQQWAKTASPLITGRNSNPTCNAYPFSVSAQDAVGEKPVEGIFEDSKGLWHIAWCWRETPDVVTNFDLCYAKSDDRGKSWKSWDGNDLELPIKPENAHVVESIAQKGGLMNGGSLVVDAEGYPYIGYTRFDENGYNQIYIATPVSNKWKIIQLTNWTHRFYFQGVGTIPEYPPIPDVSLTKGRKILITYNHAYVEPEFGQIALTREQLLAAKPGQYVPEQAQDVYLNFPNILAVNHGSLPDGHAHFMQQETDIPNRDRKPLNPKKPTMIYIIEANYKN
ncbi:MAG: BNR repeat-containing protein [Sedimentisphaerales bacterium]|nr:BNR repeat-containing protein [Sedimentisphaerales bacterium]